MLAGLTAASCTTPHTTTIQAYVVASYFSEEGATRATKVTTVASWIVQERRVLARQGVGPPRSGRDGRDARERYERVSVRLFNVHPALTSECLRTALEDIPGVRVYLLDLNCHRAFRDTLDGSAYAVLERPQGACGAAFTCAYWRRPGAPRRASGEG